MCTSMAAGLASERKFVFKRYVIIDANIYGKNTLDWCKRRMAVATMFDVLSRLWRVCVRDLQGKNSRPMWARTHDPGIKSPCLPTELTGLHVSGTESIHVLP